MSGINTTRSFSCKEIKLKVLEYRNNSNPQISMTPMLKERQLLSMLLRNVYIVRRYAQTKRYYPNTSKIATKRSSRLSLLRKKNAPCVTRNLQQKKCQFT